MKSKIIAALLAVFYSVVPSIVAAQTNIPAPPGLKNPIKYDTINDFLLAILNVVVQIGAVVIVFFFVYAGFQFVTAQGNTEKIQKAKSMFVWIVVGAFVLLGVFVIRAAICGTLNQLEVGCKL